MPKNIVPKIKTGFFHGCLTIPNKHTGFTFNLYCGSYHDRPENMLGIKLAPEIVRYCVYELPIPDFSVPTTNEVLRLIDWISNTTTENYELYLGCYGGYGRTGLIAACILVALTGIDAPDAIRDVRSKVHHNCIETPVQELFVQHFASLLKSATLEEAIALAKNEDL
ncbi:protein-tyrosine phosphatase-like protein [Vibrio phage 1.215.B._10N.222.54.F7]|nr:protein-tyrosine phosphatase-like protein [Vibrio phage 1.215.A._10N.222.54.F7]AUR96031.1 protein-tyrosine phosphatase-like protein [Vibrio phage 1.215.B._10N.222.54.F7]